MLEALELPTLDTFVPWWTWAGRSEEHLITAALVVAIKVDLVQFFHVATGLLCPVSDSPLLEPVLHSVSAPLPSSSRTCSLDKQWKF